MYASKFNMEKLLKIQKENEIVSKSDNVNESKEFKKEYALKHNLY